MPYRTVPCVTSETYHVFNRSIAGQTIFLKSKDYQRMYDLLNFYRFSSLNDSFSHYNRLPTDVKEIYLSKVKASNAPLVSISAFSLMPTHFHLAIRQEQSGGISTFMSRVQNGYAKYFNIKRKRFGALFQAMYKAVRFESEEQCLHTIRYIHINQMTAGIITRSTELEHYLWTSFTDYMGNRKDSVIDTSFIWGQFKTIESFSKFTLDQVDYQRTLAFVSRMDE